MSDEIARFIAEPGNLLKSGYGAFDLGVAENGLPVRLWPSSVRPP